MLLPAKTASSWAGLDEYLTHACLERSIGEMNLLREKAPNVRTQFIGSLVCNAVFEQDVDAIAQIAERIDGGVPDKEDREGYANILGNALEEVMDKRCEEGWYWLDENEPAIIAICKVLLCIAMRPAGNNSAKKRERAKAIEIVLRRTGGKRMEPVREAVAIDYVEPDWMQSLPASEKEDE